MPLSERYRNLINQDGFAPDPDQQVVLQQFERLRFELEQPRVHGWVARLLRRRPTHAPRGIYLWGAVGRGKTWLMDLFHEALPEEGKERLHFHRFMRNVHEELRSVAGRRAPLQLVAARLARRVRVLCLDEFNVIDIGDAMILAGLLKALFDEGIVLVTTSNRAPDDLYPSGIQRASFLPAIDLLNRHLRVVHLSGQRDHRRRSPEQSMLYLTPADGDARGRIHREFERLAVGPAQEDGALEINGRPMPYLRHAAGMVWFDFEALCGPPRSQHDYIELARTHHTVFLSDVPLLDDEQVDRARRFIFVIDEFYDRRVKLVMSAAAPFDQIYAGERLKFEFQRTASRLQEMQTPAWLARPHRG